MKFNTMLKPDRCVDVSGLKPGLEFVWLLGNELWASDGYKLLGIEVEDRDSDEVDGPIQPAAFVLFRRLQKLANKKISVKPPTLRALPKIVVVEGRHKRYFGHHEYERPRGLPPQAFRKFIEGKRMLPVAFEICLNPQILWATSMAAGNPCFSRLAIRGHQEILEIGVDQPGVIFAGFMPGRFQGSGLAGLANPFEAAKLLGPQDEVEEEVQP